MTAKIKRSRIVRLIKFLFSKEKSSSKPKTAFPIEYGFRVVEVGEYDIRVLITKNDIPYCQYDSEDASFYDPSHIELKDIPYKEKYTLWEHINKFDKEIDGFTFLCESF